jgi:hypothetical protein
MQRFLIKIILFSCPIIIVLVFGEYILRTIPNDYAKKRTFLDKKSNNVEVLFMGNSHIYYGINPSLMSKSSFNAAHISQSLNYDLAILKKYNNDLNSLKYIVVPIDYFSLYTSLESGIEKWRTKNYYIYYNISKIENFWDAFEITNSKLPNSINRIKKYLLHQKNDVTCKELGFGLNYNSKNNQDIVGTGQKAAVKHSVTMENKEIFNENIEALNQIIDFSKKHECKIIFITCPAFKTYSDHLNAKQLFNTLNAVQEITSKNQNCLYFNFLNDSNFVEGDYYDADHLNEIGAKKLTLKIDSIINTIQ